MAETSTKSGESFEAAADCLDRLLASNAPLADRIYRQLVVALHTRGIVSIDRIADEARELAGRSGHRTVDSANAPAGHRFDEEDVETTRRLTRTYVCQHLNRGEIEDVVNLALKREEAQSLADVARLPNVSFRILHERLKRFCALPLGETQLDASEASGIRVALARHFISDELQFIGIAKKHLRVRDYEDLVDRIIGSDSRMGRIGGKAGGMFLAHHILAASGVADGPFLPITIPESFYLRGDVIDQFLELNRLTSYHTQKYKDVEDIRNEYSLIKGVFRNSSFPVEIVQQLRHLLQKHDNHPLIVRSSSLLEDRFATAFSGKYASVFIPNQGPLEVRLRALLGAIGEVYASALAPDPILYRRKHNLIDYEEDMAVLIQKVVGRRMGRYFVPAFAGVAFSRNEYRWSPRIRRDDGFARVVMGLGTRAVDRVGGDFARMVALGAPTLRPEAAVNEIIAHSQRTIDVIDMERNTFASVNLVQLLNEARSFPMLDKIVSIRREGELYNPPGTIVDAPPEQMCITFDKMLKDTPLADRLHRMLETLEREFGCPVDVEFVSDGEKLYMVQCRPQPPAADIGKVTVPADLPPTDVVFTAGKFVRTARVQNIEYIVYVPSSKYHAVQSNERRMAIARAVGRINHALHDKRFILVGPGRWGSTDIRLGVRVSYADISNARMLIEVARVRDGYVPDLSFGTHFFQDLVEGNIAYLPLYPDEPPNVFNEPFLLGSPNALPDIDPRDAAMADEVRVIHVPAVAAGRLLHVAMDGETDRAAAYLAEPAAENG
ncbi:MAG: pyruvate, phosphate dikinase [Phycisphaerales bacterium]|nr:pyruvate, phosphate dikinase [Phycisphaerales bacterium]